jgi:hypothetical protein
MGNDAKATLRKALEEDENLIFVTLTDDQLGLLFDNYPKIRAKYELHDSNPIYLVLDQTTGRTSIYITCRQSSFLYTGGDMLTKMGTLELITSMMELFLFLKDAPNRQKYFGRFATLKESLLWQVRTKEGAKELTQDGHAAGLLDENTVVAASTVRGGENGGLCGGLNDPRVVPKQAALDRLLEAPEQDRDPSLIQAAEEALREAIAARETTRKSKRNGGSCGGDEDYRVDKAQENITKLLEAPEQDRDPALIQAAKEALREAIAARDSTSKAKSKAGACGGDEDYRVDEAQAEREKLLEEPMIDDVAIKVAEEKIELALAKKEKTRVGKSKGGIKAGLSGGKNDP